MAAVVEFTEGDVTWRRYGECNHCGECCKSGDPFEGARGEPEVPGACPLYREGIGCAGYGTDPYYLSGCNVWPTTPEQVVDYPSCSYSWERVNGD